MKGFTRGSIRPCSGEYAGAMPSSSTTPGPTPAAKAASAGKSPSARSELNKRKADLLQRTTRFAKEVRTFVRKTPRTIASLGDCRRLVYASGAIGANYISADEAPTRSDFLRQIGDCRKEAKQSVHWLELLDANLEEGSETMRSNLLGEAQELQKIFGAIVVKTLSNAKKPENE